MNLSESTFKKDKGKKKKLVSLRMKIKRSNF